MTEASPAPSDGWADVPRPPTEVRLDARQSRVIRLAAVRATQTRPAVLRVAVTVVLAVLVALVRGPAVGLVTAVALLALGLVPVLLTMRLVNRAVVPGALRATGYDLLGRFVVIGSSRVVLPAGWASSVAERDGLVTICPRRRGAVPVVLLRELVTAEDEAFLRDDVAGAAAAVSLTREVVVTPELRHAVWRAVQGRIVSRRRAARDDGGAVDGRQRPHGRRGCARPRVRRAHRPRRVLRRVLPSGTGFLGDGDLRSGPGADRRRGPSLGRAGHGDEHGDGRTRVDQ